MTHFFCVRICLYHENNIGLLFDGFGPLPNYIEGNIVQWLVSDNGNLFSSFYLKISNLGTLTCNYQNYTINYPNKKKFI
jgi:hypothetical protein